MRATRLILIAVAAGMIADSAPALAQGEEGALLPVRPAPTTII
jgi:hypothetical protein